MKPLIPAARFLILSLLAFSFSLSGKAYNSESGRKSTAAFHPVVRYDDGKAAENKASAFGNHLMNAGVISIFFLSTMMFAVSLHNRKRDKATEAQIKRNLAKDLHDDLGSTLNSVKMYANLALADRDEKYLYKIKESTTDAIQAVREMIWELDEELVNMETLALTIHSFAHFLCEANHIAFNIHVCSEALQYELSRDEKRNIYLILKEAINNSIKYSHGRQITVSITFYKGKPVIIIKDDGNGYTPTHSCAGNGIRNMKSRATTINYDLSIASDRGTIIQLQKI